MKEIKLNWALAPYLRSHNDGPGGTALLNFDCYVNQELFASAKNEWVGYIGRNGKKTALYNSEIVSIFLDKGYSVNLDGVVINKDDINPNKGLNAQLLTLSQGSTNDYISYLSTLHISKAQWEKQTQSVFTKLDSLWGQTVKVEDAAKLGLSNKALKFTTILSGSEVPEHDYKIDLTHGVRQTMTYEEPSHEYFVPVYFYSTLKPGVSLETLNDVATQAKSFPKKPTFNHNDKWMDGYDTKTFDPKKSDYRFKNRYY
jgi:hypothetical protein